MIIGVPLETRAGEARVAATPETIKKLLTGGHHQVLVQAGAGQHSSILDQHYLDAGAKLTSSAAELFSQAQMILKVRAPQADELAAMRSDTLLIGLLNPYHLEGVQALANKSLTAFALESLPRITRAQNMDVLSSQANIAGYKAVLVGANIYQRFMPMLMTAAGTVKAARVVVLGAGVAGLQAIATAKRLGAVVEAFDVRPAVKEQVESLGAKFIEVALSDEEKAQAETAGGYAREMSEDYRQRQAELIKQRCQQADLVITTALIPGKKAPVLLPEDTVKTMRPGSVIVDLAVEQGGNCPLSEVDQVVVKHAVNIVGYTNLPAMVAADASALYARNVINFVQLMLDAKTGEFKLNKEDEIIAATMLCSAGEMLKKS